MLRERMQAVKGKGSGGRPLTMTRTTVVLDEGGPSCYRDCPGDLWLPEPVSIDTFLPRILCSSRHAFHSLGSVGPSTTFGQTGRSSEARQSAETSGEPGPPGTTCPVCCSRPANGSQGKGLCGVLMIEAKGPAVNKPRELSRADRLSMRGRTAQV